MVSQLTIAAVAIMVAAAVYFDLRDRRIPNWLTMPGLGLGILLQVISGETAGLVNALLGVAVGTALLILPFAMGWMGGGDLKLLAAIGALMGVAFTLSTLVFALAAGGLIALAWLAAKRSLVSSLIYMVVVWLPMPGARPTALKAPIPFGPALGMGVLLAFLWR